MYINKTFFLTFTIYIDNNKVLIYSNSNRSVSSIASYISYN